jgi:hypothetical protein
MILAPNGLLGDMMSYSNKTPCLLSKPIEYNNYSLILKELTRFGFLPKIERKYSPSFTKKYKPLGEPYINQLHNRVNSSENIWKNI